MSLTKQTKLERPERVAELNPSQTLRKIGIADGDTVCDIGAGSGIFSVAAAQMTRGNVDALEIDDEMLELIEKKAKKSGFENLHAKKVTGGKFPVEDRSADLALLVTVLHEIDEKPEFLSEINRILRDSGKLAVIEFHKSETPMGPPLSHRLGREETERILSEAGFRVAEEFDLGENLYCMLFKKLN